MIDEPAYFQNYVDWLRHGIEEGEDGTDYVYHMGYLALDRASFVQTEPGVYTYTPNEPLNTFAKIVQRSYEIGLVILVQYRDGPGNYVYIARRTVRPFNGDISVLQPKSRRDQSRDPGGRADDGCADEPATALSEEGYPAASSHAAIRKARLSRRTRQARGPEGRG